MSNWKAIIVYDGCQKTHTIDDLRIEYIEIEKSGNSNENGNAGKVRNKEIELVNTSWIGYLDDDDTLSPHYVEKLLFEISENEHIDAIIFRMLSWNNIVPRPGSRDLEGKNVGISFCHKRGITDSGIIFHNSGTEDFNFLRDIKRAGYCICISPYVMYYVRQNVKSVDYNCDRFYLND